MHFLWAMVTNDNNTVIKKITIPTSIPGHINLIFNPKHMAGATAVNKLQELGLIVRNVQDSLALCPPLIITTDEIHEMFDLFEKGLDQMEAWARSENARAA